MKGYGSSVKSFKGQGSRVKKGVRVKGCKGVRGEVKGCKGVTRFQRHNKGCTRGWIGDRDRG